MRCYFTFDKELGRVLIPGCWSVVHSYDITDCTCEKFESFASFERKRYNEELVARNERIKLLEAEVAYLVGIIEESCIVKGVVKDGGAQL